MTGLAHHSCPHKWQTAWVTWEDSEAGIVASNDLAGERCSDGDGGSIGESIGESDGEGFFGLS